MIHSTIKELSRIVRSQINKVVNPSVNGDDKQGRESADTNGNKSLIASDTNDISWKTKQDRYTVRIQVSVLTLEVSEKLYDIFNFALSSMHALAYLGSNDS